MNRSALLLALAFLAISWDAGMFEPETPLWRQAAVCVLFGLLWHVLAPRKKT